MKNFFSQFSSDEHLGNAIIPVMKAMSMSTESVQDIRNYNIPDSEAIFMHASLDKTTVVVMFNIAIECYEALKKGKNGTEVKGFGKKFFAEYLKNNHNADYNEQAFGETFFRLWNTYSQKLIAGYKRKEHAKTEINSIIQDLISGNNNQKHYKEEDIPAIIKEEPEMINGKLNAGKLPMYYCSADWGARRTK